MPRSSRTLTAVVSLFAVAFFVFRIAAARHSLPEYSVDENDVVETSVGMMHGDLDHRSYGYGPLPNFVIAAVFGLRAVSLGLTLQEYARGVFFEPTEHYFIARLVCALVVLLIAVLMYRTNRDHFSREAAAIGAMLVAVPFIESLTAFTVRVDVFLALFHLLGALVAVQVAHRRHLSDHVRFGVFAALAVASKPLPGLLILPLLALAIVVRTLGEPRAEAGAPAAARAMARALVSRNVCAAALAFVICFALSHPGSILTLDEIARYQWHVVIKESAQPSRMGYDASRFLALWGLPASGVFVLSLVGTFVKPSRQKIILTGHVLLFFAAFAPFPAANHFFTPLVPTLCLLSGVTLWEITQRLGRASARRFVLATTLGIVAFQWFDALRRGRSTASAWAPHDSAPSSTMQAQHWIETNIASGSRLLYYGPFHSGPRIVAANATHQSVFGQYFLYERYRNAFLNAAFAEAYADYRASNRPVYELYYLSGSPGSDVMPYGTLNVPGSLLVGEGDVEQRISHFCTKEKIEFIVLVGGVWRETRGLVEVAKFSASGGRRSVKILKLR